MFDEKRFVIENSEGNSFGVKSQVIVDKATGVNYLFVVSGYAGGLTPLLDREGKPIVSRTGDSPEY